MDIEALKRQADVTPLLALDEKTLTGNLKMLADLKEKSGAKFLYAIKALPFAPVLEKAADWLDGFAASSLFEARFARGYLRPGQSLQLTTPGLRADEVGELRALCTHIHFNSLGQFERFASPGHPAGLRVNPKLSFLADSRFDPCRPHSKLGADIDAVWQSACLDRIEGLQIHTAFSALDYKPLVQTVARLREYFGNSLKKLKWLNLGGGYLFSRIGDHAPLLRLISELRQAYRLDVFFEPGKAVVGDAGCLVAAVVDCFASGGKTVAVLDTSVNHNPEVFEYQRAPVLHEHDPAGRYPVLLAGGTCLAGDVFGEYRLAKPPEIGDRVVFTGVGAYTLVKASRFNGCNWPSLGWCAGGRLKVSKQYSYHDFCRQWQTDCYQNSPKETV